MKPSHWTVYYGDKSAVFTNRGQARGYAAAKRLAGFQNVRIVARGF